MRAHSRTATEAEDIERQYLLSHFHQLTLIASKNYHYAFQAIRHHRPLRPNKPKLTAAANALQAFTHRQKHFAFRVLKRRTEQQQYQKAKAGMLIAVFLDRKSIGMNYQGFIKIEKCSQIRVAQRHYLRIALSNIANSFISIQEQAFQAIRQHAKRQEKKAKIIRMSYFIYQFQSKLLIDAFLTLKQPRILVHANSDEDDESIWVETYRTMANCLKMEGKNRANNQAAKREAGLRDLVGILSCKHESVMRGCFLDILCLHNQRFKPSALAVLRREIAILQQEYESV